LGEQIKKIVLWSPYGTVKRIIAAGMQPAIWNSEMTTALLITIGYAILFSVIGIKKFKWNNK
jgi:ABC-2 type transport system permease protein